MSRPIGVFACDSFGATRAGIQSILDQQDIEVLGAAATVEECIATAPHDSVGVYVLGFNPDDPPGSLLIQALREQREQAGIVAYGTEARTHIITMMYEAGASAYVPKSSDPEMLVAAVRAVAKGTHYWGAGMAEAIATSFVTGAYRSNPKHVLSTSELKIFLLLAKGTKHDEAARRLGIASQTVSNSAVTIRKKLGIERDQFERVAQEYDLI